MLTFLNDLGVSEQTINKINKENSSANIYNLNCNQDEVSKIIKYFNELGILCIDELLIYRIDLFFKGFGEIKEIFSRYETNSLVNAINNDYNIINEL